MSLLLAVYRADSRFSSPGSQLCFPFSSYDERGVTPPSGLAALSPLVANLHKFPQVAFSLLDTFKSESPAVAHKPARHTYPLSSHTPPLSPSTCHVATIPTASTFPCGLFCSPRWLTEGGSHCLNCNCYQSRKKKPTKWNSWRAQIIPPLQNFSFASFSRAVNLCDGVIKRTNCSFHHTEGSDC